MSTFPEFDDANTGTLTSVLDWLRWGASRFTEAGLFFGHGTENAWDEAIFLLSSAIHQPWELIDKIQQSALTDVEQRAVHEIYRRRVEERMPAPYLTGVSWFSGYPYKVTQDVLVPRSPIAELILKDFDPWVSEAPRQILDMCTGSGCIGIACAHQFPDAQVTLSDISPEALSVAEQNIQFHQLQGNVSALLSDGFEALDGHTFDLIIANPPYVDAQDIASMPAEFHAEPRLGLVSGDDGLDFTRMFLSQVNRYLNPNGVVIVEVGNSWVALEDAYPAVSFVWPELESGGHGVFVLTKEQVEIISDSSSAH